MPVFDIHVVYYLCNISLQLSLNVVSFFIISIAGPRDILNLLTSFCKFIASSCIYVMLNVQFYSHSPTTG